MGESSDLASPDSLRDVILARAGRLASTTRTLLRTAAVYRAGVLGCGARGRATRARSSSMRSTRPAPRGRSPNAGTGTTCSSTPRAPDAPSGPPDGPPREAPRPGAGLACGSTTTEVAMPSRRELERAGRAFAYPAARAAGGESIRSGQLGPRLLRKRPGGVLCGFPKPRVRCGARRPSVRRRFGPCLRCARSAPECECRVGRSPGGSAGSAGRAARRGSSDGNVQRVRVDVLVVGHAPRWLPPRCRRSAAGSRCRPSRGRRTGPDRACPSRPGAPRRRRSAPL